MKIPDCWDPVRQEEQRQAEFDAKCDAFPRCCECGGSIYPFDTYTEIGEFIFCEKCISKGVRITDDLEV